MHRDDRRETLCAQVMTRFAVCLLQPMPRTVLLPFEREELYDKFKRQVTIHAVVVPRLVNWIGDELSGPPERDNTDRSL